jgi:ABC-type multidrug transport system ATPase subunit
MIGVTLDRISKRFGYQTILKEISHDFRPGTITGITGRNGSGKSTLVKIISSYLSPSTGEVTFTEKGQIIKHNILALQTAFSAPYIKVTQEMNLKELIEFQQNFVPFSDDLSYSDFLDIIELPNPRQKEIRFFSSGMQQKVNLATSILRQSQLLILDEPTSYLDQKAKNWFSTLLSRHINNKTVIIASNDKDDFHLVNHICTIESGVLY